MVQACAYPGLRMTRLGILADIVGNIVVIGRLLVQNHIGYTHFIRINWERNLFLSFQRISRPVHVQFSMCQITGADLYTDVM